MEVWPMELGVSSDLLLGSLQSLRIAGRTTNASHRVHATAHALERGNRHVADTLTDDLSNRFQECITEIASTGKQIREINITYYT